MIILRYKTIPFLKKLVTHGLFYDIHAAQAGQAGTSEGQRIDDMYSRAKQYPNEVEATFSFVQVRRCPCPLSVFSLLTFSSPPGPHRLRQLLRTRRK